MGEEKYKDGWRLGEVRERKGEGRMRDKGKRGEGK